MWHQLFDCWWCQTQQTFSVWSKLRMLWVTSLLPFWLKEQFYEVSVNSLLAWYQRLGFIRLFFGEMWHLSMYRILWTVPAPSKWDRINGQKYTSKIKPRKMIIGRIIKENGWVQGVLVEALKICSQFSTWCITFDWWVAYAYLFMLRWFI